MKKLLASCAALLAFSLAHAQTPTSAPVEVDNTGTPGKATARRTAQATATITAIDAAARTLTLKA
jgi:hypothetical protein